MLERLVPDAAFRQQLLGFWEAHLAIQQRFPGGVVQFAQWAGQMPEDALEDLFLAVDALENQQLQDGGMPGAMPGGEVMVNFVDDDDDVEDIPDLPAGAQPQQRPRAPARVEEDDDEDEDEDGEEEQVAVSGKKFLPCGFGSRYFQPLPVRLLRSVITRFWGGGQANDAESSDEEHQLRDTEGVD